MSNGRSNLFESIYYPARAEREGLLLPVRGKDEEEGSTGKQAGESAPEDYIRFTRKRNIERNLIMSGWEGKTHAHIARFRSIRGEFYSSSHTLMRAKKRFPDRYAGTVAVARHDAENWETRLRRTLRDNLPRVFSFGKHLAREIRGDGGHLLRVGTARESELHREMLREGNRAQLIASEQNDIYHAPLLRIPFREWYPRRLHVNLSSQ